MADKQGRKLESIARKGEEWLISWFNGTENHSLSSRDRAVPELVETFYKLHDVAMTASPHLHPDYVGHETTHVSKLKFDWKGQKKQKNGVIFFDIKINPKRAGYIKGQTEKLLADRNQEEKKLGRWNDWCLDVFEALETEAFKYVDGERSQQEIVMEKNDGNTKQAKLNLDSEIDPSAQIAQAVVQAGKKGSKAANKV